MEAGRRRARPVAGLATLLAAWLLASRLRQGAADTASFKMSEEAARPAGAAWPAAGVHLLLAEPDPALEANASSATARLLAEVLERVGPDMRPANGFRDDPDISLEVAQLAWRNMRRRAQLAAGERVDLGWPVVERSLRKARVSQQCLAAAEATAAGAKQLKAWAVQLLNSWGSFPAAGLFEGTLGDVGSFHGCLGVPENAAIGHAHYCTLSYRPVLPARRDYELVVRQEPRPLLELFEPEDAFSRLAAKAQYHHFVYYKLGTCFPVACSPADVQSWARLLGRRAFLLSGPVKCHSRSGADYAYELHQSDDLEANASSRTPLVMTAQDLNGGIYIWAPHVSASQRLALLFLAALLALILALTLADLLLCLDRPSRAPPTGATYSAGELNDNCPTPAVKPAERLRLQPLRPATQRLRPLLAELAHDCSLRTSLRDFLASEGRPAEGEIGCLDGLRCLTMSWIILAHTIQYNDWSAFARIYAVEAQLRSWFNQPVLNASYLVDTFFLISGLLTSYSAFRPGSREPWARFSARNYLLGRYLRLTPQILLVSCLFILLPLVAPAGGPHWPAMTSEHAENCANNWWLNLLHIQAFYRSDQMCNFVCWWVSVDMFYHLIALALLVPALRLGPGLLLRLSAPLALANALLQATRHHSLGLPPNLLATIPQVGAMWSIMTLQYFWTPLAHLLPFLVGLWLGQQLARRRAELAAWCTPGRARAGWLATPAAFALVLLGTHWWAVGAAEYSASTATLFNLGSQLLWAAGLAWTILAAHLNHAGPLGRLLAWPPFAVLGRASYLVYLSHFLVLFTFFGSQNLLLEPTPLMLGYIALGNTCLSMLLGSLLCVVFELPWLKLQRRIMRSLQPAPG